jgi:hypothetical protein
MKDAVRTRQRMLALALPITAALYIAAEGLDPRGTDRIVTTTAIASKVLPIAAKHSTQLFVSGSLSELAQAYGQLAICLRSSRTRFVTVR